MLDHSRQTLLLPDPEDEPSVLHALNKAKWLALRSLMQKS